MPRICPGAIADDHRSGWESGGKRPPLTSRRGANRPSEPDAPASANQKFQGLQTAAKGGYKTYGGAELAQNDLKPALAGWKK